MPVPWEALIPFGIGCLNVSSNHQFLTVFLILILGLLTVMFGAAGTLVKTSKQAQNLGKVRCGIYILANGVTKDFV